MSEEDAFLDGIAANRADRTRLLVFADWLAEHDDPREEFVRLHARLLEMDGTEPEFAGCEKVWNRWIFGSSSSRRKHPRVGAHWVDALCRVCTTADVARYAENRFATAQGRAERTEYGADEHIHTDSGLTLVYYHGDARDYDKPLEFVAETLLAEFEYDPFRERGTLALDYCYPIVRGNFWRTWRALGTNLRVPPPAPTIATDNPFLAAEHLANGPDNSGMVATYRDDYFALFWSTTT
jgi:uncharacterized protein (TIGR02996 family)